MSTSIRDVVRPYGERDLVSIADTQQEFVAAVERIFATDESERLAWLGRVDDFLSGMSWDETWTRMLRQIDEVVTARASSRPARVQAATMKAAIASA